MEFQSVCRALLRPWGYVAAGLLAGGRGARVPGLYPQGILGDIRGYIGVYWCFIGIVEKKMETTIVGYIGFKNPWPEQSPHPAVSVS